MYIYAPARCPWLLLASPGCPWLPPAAPGCSWLLLAPGRPWLPPGSWLLPAAPSCSWLLLAAPGCSWLLAATSWRRGTLGHARPHRSQRQICYDLPRPAKQNKNRSVEPIESDAMRIMKNHATHKQNIDKCKKTNAEDPKLSGSVEARHRTMSRNCSQTKKCYD